MKNAVLTAEELSSIRNVDRLIPIQPALSKQFTGNMSNFYARLEAVLLSIQTHKTVGDKWKIHTKPGVSYASLGSDLGTLYFYQLLIRLGGITEVLELGTYIGVSTLFLAEAVGQSGRVTTVEFGKEFHDIARENFVQNGYANRITQILGCAVETLHAEVKAGKKFGFILMDAAKERYAEMLQPALACLSSGGLLLVDDIFFQGDTLNDIPTSEKGMGVRNLLKEVALLDNAYSKAILPIGNGLMLIHAQ